MLVGSRSKGLRAQGIECACATKEKANSKQYTNICCTSTTKVSFLLRHQILSTMSDNQETEAPPQEVAAPEVADAGAAAEAPAAEEAAAGDAPPLPAAEAADQPDQAADAAPDAGAASAAAAAVAARLMAEHGQQAYPVSTGVDHQQVRGPRHPLRRWVCTPGQVETPPSPPSLRGSSHARGALPRWLTAPLPRATPASAEFRGRRGRQQQAPTRGGRRWRRSGRP